MKKTALLILFVLFCSTNIFALEKDTLYKYAKLDFCLSAGSTETYDKEGDERGMVSIGFMANAAFGLQLNRFRYELSYQERAEVSEMLQTMLGLISTLTVRAGMANVFYDYLTTRHFAMYVGTGIGLAYYDLTMKTWSDFYEDSGYSCILGAYTGLTFIIKEVFFIDLGFDYYYINKPETNTFAPKIGFRYAF
jgi:opacity protein-like surface antigen